MTMVAVQPEVVHDRTEPHYMRNGQYRAKINTAAPYDLRKLLVALGTRGDAADVAQTCVETQLAAWAKVRRETLEADVGLGTPLGVDLDSHGVAELKTGQGNVEAAVGAIAKDAGADNAKEKALWTWERLPYAVRQAGLRLAANKADDDEDGRPKKKTRAQDGDKFVADVDEWILRNESYLRLLSRAAKLPEKTDPKPWTYGLLGLEDIPLVVQSHEPVTNEVGMVPSAVKITRAPLAAVPGYSFLGQKRADAVYIQPNVQAFQKRWQEMTGGLLDGLDWNNVCVAGGLVLGTILTPDVPAANKPSEWASSDIDLYIYGLPVHAANAKVEHIAETYKRNLPGGATAPFLVVRNSQTVTLYSAYPTRRVQIVLKLVSSPREVLLNFDLDVVAAAYDGSNVWILPRFVRALETGSNIFTMDLINGHYLGDRKATRDKRVFKYANKGYALRILPSYLAALSTYNTRAKIEAQSRGDRLFADLSLDARAGASRAWTQAAIKHYLRAGQADAGVPFYWPKRYPRVASDRPVFSHAMLEGYGQTTAEPLGRSCLTGFALLMRHVALWEEEVAGRIKIFEDLYATDTYGEGPMHEVAYDDSPAYTWDESFSIPEFKRALDAFNEREEHAASERRERRDDWCDRKSDNDSESPSPHARRIAYGDSVAATGDLVIPLLVPREFMRLANREILAGLKHAGVDVASEGPLVDIEPAAALEDGEMDSDSDENAEVLWRLDAVLNWQMLDRGIDEVREVLWAFHRANERSYLTESSHDVEILKTTISRRAIRTCVEEEMDAFVRWVGRAPYEDSPKLNAVWKLLEEGGFEEGEDDEDEDEDD